MEFSRDRRSLKPAPNKGGDLAIFREVSRESEQGWATVPPKGLESGLFPGPGFSLSFSQHLLPTCCFLFFWGQPVSFCTCPVMVAPATSLYNLLPLGHTPPQLLILSVQMTGPDHLFKPEHITPGHWPVYAWGPSGSVQLSVVGEGTHLLLQHPLSFFLKEDM